jgi:hypothetical protein
VSAYRASATRRIAAPANALFQIVSSADGHVQIDGSGMLQAAPDARPIAAVGDTFAMDMDREPLGDYPLGKYTVQNTVTQMIPDRLFEWGVGRPGEPTYGHVYGWQLEPVSDTETDVTNYCDWSKIPNIEGSDRIWPIVPLHMLEKSVEKLEQIATQG